MYKNIIMNVNNYVNGIIWKPPSLSELTQIIPIMELTHLGSEASIYITLVTAVNLFDI